MNIATAEELGRMLARAAVDLDESAVRAELELRFPNTVDIEAGLATWRSAGTATRRAERARADLA